MTIASEVTKLNTNLTNSYTAVSDKGGTLPASQNFDNLATAIGSIPSGSTSEKYGATVDTFLGNINNGILQVPTVQSDLVFTGVTDVTDNALYYKFAKTSVKSVSLPNLTTISGDYGCSNMFSDCPNLASVSLPNLTTISGDYGCSNMFSDCPNLASVSLPNLTTISGNDGCNYFLNNCTSITSVSLPKLTTISGSYCMQGWFSGCKNLTDVYFNSLTTSSFVKTTAFRYLMQNTGSRAIHTLHFPSNMESTISGLTGYPLFSGTSGYVVLVYDLPATS